MNNVLLWNLKILHTLIDLSCINCILTMRTLLAMGQLLHETVRSIVNDRIRQKDYIQCQKKLAKDFSLK
jgi:hypothetical protein